MDLLDYLKWRSDLTFEERAFNEVDSLVFCAVSYEILDEVVTKEEELTVNELAKRFFEKYDEEVLKKRLSVSKRSYEVLKAMAHTKRYGNLKLSHYMNEIDDDMNLQFSAMTFTYHGGWKAIVFRGTDDTITGWKEDFSMLYKDEVLAQKKAIKYIQEVCDDKPKHFWNRKMNYIVIGHSKGGHLAMIASLYASEEVQSRIVRIDNFDGPGLDEKHWQHQQMKQIASKITTYLPTGSFFGRMFHHEERCVIVSSKGKGLVQHNPYNWQVEVDHLIKKEVFEESSDKAVEKMNELVKMHTPQELEEIAESVFRLLDTLKLVKLADILKVEITSVLKALKELSETDTKTKKLLIELLSLVWNMSF